MLGEDNLDGLYICFWLFDDKNFTRWCVKLFLLHALNLLCLVSHSLSTIYFFSELICAYRCKTHRLCYWWLVAWLVLKILLQLLLLLQLVLLVVELVLRIDRAQVDLRNFKHVSLFCFRFQLKHDLVIVDTHVFILVIARYLVVYLRYWDAFIMNIGISWLRDLLQTIKPQLLMLHDRWLQLILKEWLVRRLKLVIVDQISFILGYIAEWAEVLPLWLDLFALYHRG